jgi:hypothetical protein
MLFVLMSPTTRHFQNAADHDGIYASLDLIGNWIVKADLTLIDTLQKNEADRVGKFHQLIRDISRRFTEHRDLQNIGWFLRQEGNGSDKRFHFHLLLTSQGLCP